MLNSFRRSLLPLNLSRLCSSESTVQGVVPCSFFKDQPDPPLKPREEYPEWLWKLLEKPASLKELTAKFREKGEEGLTEDEAQRLSRLGRKKAIRDGKKGRGKF